MSHPIQANSTLLAFVLMLASTLAAAIPADRGGWVAESDANTALLLQLTARYSPEDATGLGLDGYEQEISDLSRDRYDDLRRDRLAVIAELEKRRDAATHPKVRQDLEILIDSTQRQIESDALERKYFLPYTNAASFVFNVTHNMLDARTPEAIRPALITRLNKYAGLEKGYRPLTELARERTLERLAVAPDLIGPYRADVEQDLASVPVLMSGMKDLLEQSGLKGWRKPYAALERQMTEYYAWVRTDILPRARTDHRLPEEIYADNLRNYGVDIPPGELVARALTSFAEIRNEMQAVAGLIAADRKLPDPDYRAVMRVLKQQQIPNDQLLPLYEKRLAQLEALIRDHDIVTLPARPAHIRLASPAESAQQPAPHMRPPRMINNTGQYGEFVLPLSLPPDPSGKQLRYDDFSHDAGTWTLTAHEARPGHEMQFARMVEDGISQARAIYARNSVNTEGWALYAEAEMKPFLPLEGQLFALQHRMMRAARAFLDPMVNQGELTPAEVTSFLQDEVGLSEAMATQEMERYTFRAPGQATSYFYGYQRLMETRQAAQLALRGKFNQKAFNDFVLDQGMIPPGLLKKAVMEEFVPAQAGH